MNVAIVFYILARVLQVEGAFLMLPFLVGMCYREKEAFAFLLVGVVLFLIGTFAARKKPKNTSFYAKEGFVTVTLSWIVLGITGAVPYVLNGDIPHYINAVFEIVSGFTTTGASILTNVEGLSYSSKFWRCFSNWIGGMGVLVFVLSILPLGGAQNIYIMKAESPGPSVGKLVPKVKSTAANLYKIYCGMTLIEIILLLFGGLDLFSAVTLSFSTAGTGGFAVLNSGCLSYSSYVQIVLTIFMIAFGVNFSVYYLILTKRVKQAVKSEELRWYLIIMFSAIILILCNVADRFDSIFAAVKHVSFTVGSIMTSTGLSTVDFNLWPTFSKTLLVLLMFVGACAGSTGGGIKVSRIVIYFKTMTKMVGQQLHPRSIKVVKFEGKPVEHDVIRGVNAYLVSFLFLYACSMLLLALDNFDFETNFSAVIACINNIGPGIGLVGPAGNYSEFSCLSKLVMSIDMLAGRLEIFPLLVFCSPKTYKK